MALADDAHIVNKPCKESLQARICFIMCLRAIAIAISIEGVCTGAVTRGRRQDNVRAKLRDLARDNLG